MSTSSAVADLGKKLLEASRKGNAEEVRQLMANGAPITTDWLGTSPLHLAAQYGHTVTAEVLLKAGVSRDGKTKVDKTPLHLAAQQGHFEIAQMLVKCGALINATDMLTMTPLHWAVEAQSERVCKLLMEHGARTDIKNKFGKTAVDISRSKGWDNILTILISIAYAPHENGGKRHVKHEESFFLESKKRARTRKFPMTAGSWTVGEMQTADKEERLRAKEPKMMLPNGDMTSDARSSKVVSAEASNLSSLVDAADIVRSKVKYSNENNNVDPEPSAGFTRKFNTEPSVLHTLATLATASTQMATAVSDSNQQAQKVASIPNPTAVAPSYVTIPGIQGPVSIIQANQTQPGLVQQVTSGLPPGMIQLPLAFNILPGGRIQIGQSVLPGHPLGLPIQMPVQPAPGIPTGHLLTVTSGANIAVVGGIPPGHIIPKPMNVTDTTPSGQGVVMSPVSQGITSLVTSSSTTSNPKQLLNSTTSTTFQCESSRQGEFKPPSSSNFAIQPSIIAQQQQPHQQQPGISPSPLTPSQIASAFQYANLGSGIAPIPLVPVAGIGGIQFVPQAMLQTHLLNAFRGGVPQSPNLGATVQPQVVTPGGAYTIPMSPLNLSSILPTALSLSQLPLSQQTISSLAQQSMVSSIQTGAPGAQDILNAVSQPPISFQNEATSSAQKQKRGSIHSNQSQLSTSTKQSVLPFPSSGAQINLGPGLSQPQLATVLAQQAFGAHHNISVADLQQNIANSIAYQALNVQSTADTPGTTQSLSITADQLGASAQSVTDIESLVRRQTAATATTKSEDEHVKQAVFHDSNKENLLSHLTMATVESRSPSLIVNSSHSPRMPISPGNFVRNEDEMRGISPSQISPTKSRNSTQNIFTSSEDENSIMGTHVQAVTKPDELHTSSPFSDGASQRSLVKDSSAVTMFSGDHILPHLQQLIYKQLLHQQQQQHQSLEDHNPVTTSQSLSHETEEAKNDANSQSRGPSPITRDYVNRTAVSTPDDFEDRSHDQPTAQSEYFWRVIEQENSSLKRHLESDLDDNLYSDGFHKTDRKSHEREAEDKNDEIASLLIKGELTGPPETVVQSNSEDD